MLGRQYARKLSESPSTLATGPTFHPVATSVIFRSQRLERLPRCVIGRPRTRLALIWPEALALVFLLEAEQGSGQFDGYRCPPRQLKGLAAAGSLSGASSHRCRQGHVGIVDQCDDLRQPL